MQRSVTGVMMMNIFGIPFAGADICGFTGPATTPYLCARWTQLGALYPFSRNHRDCSDARQEPYQYAMYLVNGTNTTVMEVMRDAILVKYSLIKYYYTHLFTLSKLDTNVGTLYKPLFFAFPNDPLAFEANPSENVMIGPSLKLSIKLTPNHNTVNDTNTYYFPAGTWCDILHPKSDCIVSYGNNTVELDAGVKDYQLHIKDGEIVVFQDA
jgi:alpha-glucosidase (family GH31 glycosyl hydrolase)